MHTTVASVGPYKLAMAEFGAAICHAAHTLARSGSPAKNVYLSEGNALARSNPMRPMNAAIAGTESQVVISCSCTNFAGAIACAGGITCTDAPARHAANML